MLKICCGVYYTGGVITMTKREIVPGQKYGNFQVVSFPFKENNIRKVICECECGNKTNIACCNIKRATKCKSCSKKQRKRLYKIGQRINSFTIIGFEERKNNRSLIKSQCDCGRIIVQSSSSLKRTKMCRACFNKIRGKEHPAFRGREYVSGTYFAGIKAGARNRNIEFNLSIDYINSLIVYQNHLCAISKLAISEIDSTASLDRIDSSKGYIIGNVQWVHKDVNKMKMDFEQSYFINLCKKIGESNA